jgi:hypothetical protein
VRSGRGAAAVAADKDLAAGGACLLKPFDGDRNSLNGDPFNRLQQFGFILSCCNTGQIAINTANTVINNSGFNQFDKDPKSSDSQSKLTEKPEPIQVLLDEFDLVGLYMNDISCYPLIDHREEIELAKTTGETPKKVFKSLRKLFENEIIDCESHQYKLLKTP